MTIIGRVDTLGYVPATPIGHERARLGVLSASVWRQRSADDDGHIVASVTARRACETAR